MHKLGGETVDRNLWHFLDVPNMNLLYKYADVLSGNQCYLILKTSQTNKKSANNAEAQNQEKLKSYILQRTNLKEYSNKITTEQREAVYYLIWFVYYYVLECKTLEQALLQDHADVLRQWDLYKFICNKYIFLGGDICILPLYREEDFEIILEILYNRYSAIEQFECYLRHFGDKNDKRTNICRQAIEMYKSIKGKRFYDSSEND